MTVAPRRFASCTAASSDSPRGPCYEHSLRRDAGSVQHVLCGRIGARYGCEFFIAAVAANGVRLSGGGDRELCEPAVTFAAEGPALERPIADRRPQHVPYEDSLADATARNSTAHVDDTAADVRALDARELKGGTRPRGVHVVDAVEARCATFTGLGGDRLRIPSDPRVHVRIVDTGRGNLNENLTPSRARNLHVRPVLESFQPAMPGEQDGGHRRRQQDRVPPLGGDAGAYHCCVTRRAGRTTAGSSIRAEPIRTLDGNQRRSTPFADETAISPASGWSPRWNGPSTRYARPPRSAPRHPRRRSRPVRHRTWPGSDHAWFPPAA